MRAVGYGSLESEIGSPTVASLLLAYPYGQRKLRNQPYPDQLPYTLPGPTVAATRCRTASCITTANERAKSRRGSCNTDFPDSNQPRILSFTSSSLNINWWMHNTSLRVIFYKVYLIFLLYASPNSDWIDTNDQRLIKNNLSKDQRSNSHPRIVRSFPAARDRSIRTVRLSNRSCPSPAITYEILKLSYNNNQLTKLQSTTARSTAFMQCSSSPDAVVARVVNWN